MNEAVINSSISVISCKDAVKQIYTPDQRNDVRNLERDAQSGLVTHDSLNDIKPQFQISQTSKCSGILATKSNVELDWNRLLVMIHC